MCDYIYDVILCVENKVTVHICCLHNFFLRIRHISGVFFFQLAAYLNLAELSENLGRDGLIYWPSWIPLADLVKLAEVSFFGRVGGQVSFFGRVGGQLGQKNVGRVFVNMFGKIGRGVLFWPSLVYILDDSAKKFGAESGSLAESSAPRISESMHVSTMNHRRKSFI